MDLISEAAVLDMAISGLCVRYADNAHRFPKEDQRRLSTTIDMCIKLFAPIAASYGHGGPKEADVAKLRERVHRASLRLANRERRYCMEGR